MQVQILPRSTFVKMKAITCDAIITGVSSRADRSLSLRICTPELLSSECAAFHDIKGMNLKALFQPVDSAPQEFISVKNDLDMKSPSQRLRAVLFVVWKQLKPDETNFELFYLAQMNEVIERFKAQLEPWP